MKYKGDYSPSYLADPVSIYLYCKCHECPSHGRDTNQEEYTWHPLEVCTTLLDKYHYATFAHPEHSLRAPAGFENGMLLVLMCGNLSNAFDSKS